MLKPGRTLTSALACGAILLFGDLPPASGVNYFCARIASVPHVTEELMSSSP